MIKPQKKGSLTISVCCCVSQKWRFFIRLFG